VNTTPEGLSAHEDALPPSKSQSSPPPRSILRRIFIGDAGLRAGWGLLIFVAMFAGLAFTINFILRKLGAPDPRFMKELPPLFGILGEGSNFLVILLITWIMSKIERRPNFAYGLGGRSKLQHCLAGLGWGIVCLSLLILTLTKTGLLIIDRRLIFGGDILRYGAIWLFGFFLVGLLEEYLVRGYVQFTLTRGLAAIYAKVFKTRHSDALGFWTAATMFSIFFGLGHGKNPGESPIGLLSAGLAGMVFCLSLWRTGSLWWAIGFHASWDWGQSYLYGVADSGLMVQHHLLATHPVGKPVLSGGATGPEGSIVILGVFVLIILIIVFTLSRVGGGYDPNLRARHLEA
jgi:uncharacterized protein